MARHPPLARVMLDRNGVVAPLCLVREETKAGRMQLSSHNATRVGVGVPAHLEYATSPHTRLNSQGRQGHVATFASDARDVVQP
eukprot:3892379-Prymnesium_polylepis.1